MAKMWNPKKEEDNVSNPVIILYGESDTGKTTLAATAANLGNTLLIAFSSQEQVVKKYEYKYELMVYSCETLRDVTNIATYLHKGKQTHAVKTIAKWVGDIEFEYIIFDGFTQAQASYQIALQTANPSDTELVTHITGNVSSGVNTMEMDDFKMLMAHTVRLMRTFSVLKHTYTVIVTMYERKPSIDLTKGGTLEAEKKKYRPYVDGGGAVHAIGEGNILARMEAHTWRDKATKITIEGKRAHIKGTDTFVAWNRYIGGTTATTINNPTIALLLGLKET